MVAMTAVKSSNVAAIGHDAAKSELHVQFQNGKTYRYANVPAAKHQALLTADSIGSHLNAHIKPHHKVI